MTAIVSGVRTALLLAVVAPIALASGTLAGILWGPRAGAITAVFTAACGVLLLDILLIGLRKIPFACRYYPGRSRIRTLWPFYLLAFLAYAYSLAHLERLILARPMLLGVVLLAVAALTGALAYLRHRDLQPPPGLIYQDEDPDAIFEGFRLSEGLAAERRIVPGRY